MCVHYITASEEALRLAVKWGAGRFDIGCRGRSISPAHAMTEAKS